VGILVDLRDLAARGKAGAFTLRLEALREAHAKKPSFIKRRAAALTTTIEQRLHEPDHIRLDLVVGTTL
jgi:hypothetical protein